jgi:hypothetical protein
MTWQGWDEWGTSDPVDLPYCWSHSTKGKPYLQICNNWEGEGHAVSSFCKWTGTVEEFNEMLTKHPVFKHSQPVAQPSITTPQEKVWGAGVDEDWCKFAAGIMLSDMTSKIVVPEAEEWFGLNMLERDDELSRFIK